MGLYIVGIVVVFLLLFAGVGIRQYWPGVFYKKTDNEEVKDVDSDSISESEDGADDHLGSDGEPVHCVQEDGEWSECVPSDGVCGEGIQTRTTPILQRPNRYGTPCRAEYAQQTCIVDCGRPAEGDGDAVGDSDQNCIATVGEFGACSTTCGPGIQRRQVNIIQHPRGYGTHCPAAEIPCNERDCDTLAEDDGFTDHLGEDVGFTETEDTANPKFPAVTDSDCVPGLTPTWSACSEQVCGKGLQYKTRVVSVPATGSGLPCVGIGQRVFQECTAPGQPNWSCERTPIYSGNDVGKKSGASESLCASSCNGNPSCSGFSFENGTCYLKSVAEDSTGGKMFHTRLDSSGQPLAMDGDQQCAPVPGYACSQTPVYSGSDDTMYSGRTVAQCKTLCESRPSCVGFSRASDGKCWLKTAKNDITHNKRFYRKIQ